MAASARERIVATATPLFLRHGFHAIGLDRILSEAGLTKTTFYNHFESKDDLIIEVIRQRDEYENARWMREIPQRAGDAPRRQLELVFEVLSEWFHDEGFLGCIFMTATAEFANPHDPVHRAAAQHYHAFADMVRARAAALGIGDVPDFVDEYMLIVHGTIAMRMTSDARDAAQVGGRMVTVLIDRYLANVPEQARVSAGPGPARKPTG